MHRQMPEPSTHSYAVQFLLSCMEKSASATLLGARGTGKSHTLRKLSQELHGLGSPHLHIPRGASDAAERLAAAPIDQPHLIDGFESASDDLVAVLATRIRQGGFGVLAIRTSSRPTAFDSPHLNALRSPSDVDITPFDVFELPLLDYGSIASEVRRITAGQVSSATLSTISALSWGRPAWIPHLVSLSTQNRLSQSPWPEIRPLQAVNAQIPEVSRSLNRFEAGLSAEAAATAVAMSAISPRTMTSWESLIGTPLFTELLAHDLLIPAPGTAGHNGVPELTAAGLLMCVNAQQLTQARSSLASELTRISTFGLPLDGKEMYFCARYLSPSFEDTEVAELHNRFITETISDCLSFNVGDIAEALYPLIRSAQKLPLLIRARTALVLQDAVAAQRLLSHELASSPSLVDGERFAARAFYACLAAETRPAGAETLHAPTLVSSLDTAHDIERHQAEQLVFEKWNEAKLSAEGRAQLVQYMRGPDGLPEMHLIAEQLLVLDRITQGLRSTRTSSSSRYADIAQFAMSADPAHRDLLASAAVAEGMILLYTGETVLHADELRALGARLNAPAFQSLWIEHLIAAAEALTGGDLERARREWDGLQARLPRVLPARLRHAVTATGKELHNPGSTPAEERVVPHHLLTYFTGRLDHISAAWFLSEPQTSSGAHELNIVHIARAHVRAESDQNPTALLAVATDLHTHRLWVPAIFAVRDATAIYRRRRAAGGVTRCETYLSELIADARLQFPWFDSVDTTETARATLTARELEVAKLAAKGRRNKDIAEKLSCSVRTVESHLANARAKLGAANRTELADKLTELEL